MMATLARNQGRPRPKRMSNTLLPTALAMAMSASPWRATIIEPMASGMLVPTARTTTPMIGCKAREGGTREGLV